MRTVVLFYNFTHFCQENSWILVSASEFHPCSLTYMCGGKREGLWSPEKDLMTSRVYQTILWELLAYRQDNYDNENSIEKSFKTWPAGPQACYCLHRKIEFFYNFMIMILLRRRKVFRLLLLPWNGSNRKKKKKSRLCLWIKNLSAHCGSHKLHIVGFCQLYWCKLFSIICLLCSFS